MVSGNNKTTVDGRLDDVLSLGMKIVVLRRWDITEPITVALLSASSLKGIAVGLCLFKGGSLLQWFALDANALMLEWGAQPLHRVVVLVGQEAVDLAGYQ